MLHHLKLHHLVNRYLLWQNSLYRPPLGFVANFRNYDNNFIDFELEFFFARPQSTVTPCVLNTHAVRLLIYNQS